MGSGTPLPPIYWNQHVSEKTQNNLSESIVYGQNPGSKGLSVAAIGFATLPPPSSSSAIGAVEGKVGCHMGLSPSSREAEVELVSEMA
jgi:hypothetical protein